MTYRLSYRVIALLVAVLVMLSGVSAEAIELPPGSKNFDAPTSTPNYFSNEVGAAQGNRSVGSVPIGHISGPNVGHSVVMSGPRGKPGKIVRVKRRGHGRGGAARGRVTRVAGRHGAASSSRRGAASSPSHARVTKASAAKAAPRGGGHHR